MPVSPSALAALVQSNVNSRMEAVSGYAPLQQKDSSYFIEMCQAIGTGIISGAPTITFTTNDGGVAGQPPVPGTGTGTGITVNPTFFVQDLYTRLRGYVIDDFGKTLHEPYPPSPGNSGQYLLALCNGINDSFLSYYPTAWTLTSENPLIYKGTGTISDGNFSGLSTSAIQSSIQSSAPKLQGKFWPRIAQGIAESYVSLIENNSTGQVTITGVCVVSPGQICNLRASQGNGTGVAS